MRKFYLFLIASLICFQNTEAQISKFCFTATSGTYTAISGGTAVNTIEQDDANVINIPFNFSFNYLGTNFTQASVSSNGWLSFSNNNPGAGTSSSNNIATTSLVNTLFPLWDDLSGTGGVAGYQTTGAAGNRIFTMEWRNWRWNYNASGAVISFQVKLYEGSNIIEFIYRQEGTGINTSGFGYSNGASIGLNDGTGGSTHYLSLNNAGANPTVSSTAATNNITTKPATGQIYRFTPSLTPTISGISPNPVCAAGSTVTITGTNFNACLSAVSFNGTAATTYNYVNATTITATVPAGATTGPVSITTPGGTATSASNLTIGSNGTITLGSGNANPTVCINSPITNIVYNIGGSATGASLSGSLPGGVTGSYSSGSFTISGTPTASGTFNFTVTTTGSACTNPSLSGTITVQANATINLTSAAGTINQTGCINTPVTNITYLVGGTGTGANVTGLPSGVTGSYNAGTKVFTISGTPGAAGTFNYTVTTTGPCGNTSANGIITVTDDGSIVLSSAPGSNTQSVCLNNAITDITYTIGGTATGASVIAGSLPAGITGTYNAGVFTISGTATASGVYNFTVGTSGSTCANPSLTGTITVNEDAVITLSSATGTDAQSLCALTAITDITYAISGFGVSGATVTGLPAGVNGNYAAGVFTISGAPTATGVFNYTVTTTGLCANNALSGTITSAANGTVTLSSAAGTDAQTVCINNPITDISFTIDPSANDASITSGTLPAGVTGVYNAGVFTISGTPTATGTYTFTVTASGSPCSNFSANAVINVHEDATINLSSAIGTDAQTVCINNAISDITYAVGGFGTSGATVSGLPSGLAGTYNSGVLTISGTPTVPGIFNYTVTTTGDCAAASLNGTITVQANSTITLSSGAGSDNQVKCINTAITNITYTIGGDATGAGITAGTLPAGVTGSFAAGVFTISGTPTIPGTFTYTVTTTGPCVNVSINGSIVVNDNATIALTSAAGTDAQTKCINTPVTAITYLVGGSGTGVTLTGALPAGVTGTYNAGTQLYTISGTPTVAGTFNYTVTTNGPCINANLSGTITVQPNSTISLSSAVGTNNQTKCINTALTNIVYTMGGSATGISITAGSLPAGVTGTFAAGVFTISGTPTVAGTYPYTVTAAGPCLSATASGTIVVNDNATIALTSAAGTDNQTKCINTAITPVTYLVAGSGTGVTLTGTLPAGVTGTYNSGTKVYSISGTPTVAGTFNYTVTTTGPCINASVSGTFIIQANSTINLTSAAGTNNQTKCINTALTTITYSMGGGATNISLTTGSFPTGVTGSFAAGVFTISGTPTVAGSFPYTLTASGPCVNATATGTITINDNSTITLTSAAGTNNQTKCISTAITPITYLIGGGGTGVTLTGSLPAGVTGNYNSGTKVYTISGTATAAGTFNYTVTTTGPCTNVSASGTIIVTPNSTITLSSGTASQTKCINTALTTVTFTMGGSATSVSLTSGSFPTGVTGSFAAGVFTISGTPTVAGSFPYTLTATGPCANATASGTITVNDNSTITITSAAGTNNQTKCINTAITPITYLVGGGGTGVTLTGSLPAGVTGTYNSGTKVYSISGSPTVAGTFNYTVTTTGPCTNVSASGTIIVTPNSTIALTSGAGSNVQSLCQNTAINNITYSIGGSGTGATVTNLPAGVTGTYSGGVFTISGAPTASGTFNFVVTTTGPCVNPSLSGTLTVSAVPTGSLTASESSVIANDNIICAGANVTFTATAGYGSYIFKVNGITAQSGLSNVFNTSTLTNGASVTVDVANAANCGTTFGPIVITVNALPVPSLSADRTSICTNESVTFTAGGGTAYTFNVNGSAVQSGSSNTYSSSTLTNGSSVTVTVTNANGCNTTSAPIVITVNSLPTGTLTATENSGIANDNNICTGANVTFTATAGFSAYNFKVNGISVQNGASNTFSTTTLSNPAVITVDITNAAGCQSSFNPIVITVNALPTGTLTATENSGVANDNSICSGSQVAFTATAGFTNYDFQVNGLSQQNGLSSTFNTSTLSNGDIVTVVVTNGNSCSTSFNAISFTVIPSPSGTLAATTTSICAGDNIDFTATGGYSNYDFQVNGSTVQNGNLNTYSTASLNNGDVVTVIVTGANDCVSVFNSLTINVNALPSGSLVAVENSGATNNDGNICIGASVVFTAPAGYSNYIFLLNAISVQNGSSNTYTNNTLSDGDVVGVAITNATGCISLLNTITISVSNYPVVDAISGLADVCDANSIQLTNTTPSGVWSSSNTTVATVDASGLVTGNAPGNASISYTVTNANGCSTTVSHFLTVHSLPFVAGITGSTDVCIGNTTQLSNVTIGGTWNSNNNSIATVDATGLVTGIADGTADISYTVTNIDGCTKIKTVTVTVNAPPVLNPITGDDSICQGATSLLSNDTDGGTWSSNNTSVATVNAASGLVTAIAPGNAVISYMVTDGNGCSATVTIPVTVLSLPVPTLSGPNPICPNSTGIYTTEAGQLNYTWTFTGGTLIAGGTGADNTITILWDQPGPKTINVNYTNADGCFGAASATVTTSSGITPFLSGPITVCQLSNELYTTDPGQSNYTWNVTGGTISAGGTSTDNTATVTWNTAGTGTVTINYDDVNGCTVVSPTVLNVNVHTLPNATLTGNAAVCQNASSPVITFTGSNGTAPYTFTYNVNGGADQTISTVSGNSVTLAVPTATTGTFTYTLTAVTDNNSCERILNTNVSIQVNEPAAGTISGDATVCQNSTAAITFTATAGTAPFTFQYNINGGGTQSVTTVSGNTVTVAVPTSSTGTFIYNLLSVSDANNCIQVQSGSATVVVNLSPTATISGTTTVCQDAASPVITFTGNNGIAPYTFTYNINGGGNITVTSVGNTATVAVPTATPGTFNYNLVSVQESGTNTCSQLQTGTAAVTVSATSVGGTVSSDNTVCSGTNSGTLTLSGHTGSVLNWEMSINGGGSWSVIANNTTTLNYTNLTQTTLYHAVVQNGACGSVISGNATITVTTPSVGGTVSSNATVCSGTNSGTLTLSGHTGSVTGWEFSTNGGGSWTAIANTTTTQNYLNLVQTTQYRAIVSNGVCASTTSAVAIITVNSLPTATISGTTTVCQNGTSPVITFTGANGTAPYTFTYNINGGSNLTIVSVGNIASLNASTATAGVFNYNLVSVQSSGSPACAQNQSGTASITVSALPATFTITPASASICQGTVQPLSAAGGTPTSGSVTFSSGTINQSIPDPGNRANSIAVSGIPAGAVITGVSVNFNVTHTYDADLVLNLTAPNGNTLNLVNKRGSNNDNFTNTTISSASVNPINAGVAPFTNTYAADAVNNTGTPNSNVNSFASLYSTPNGNWTINAADVVGCHGTLFLGICFGNYESGTLNSWSITVNYTLPVSPINVVWSPLTGLYTDAGATTAYAGQNVSTVYATPNTTTTYTATSTNAAGCSATKTVNVAVSPTPVVTITSDYCVVPGKVRLTATSVPVATSYLWSTGATTSFIDVDIAGSFDVTVFAGGGCPGTTSINVAQELVVNGDFEAGNVGFVTPPLGANQYAYQADVAGNTELYPEGLYGIGPNANTYHNNFWGHDHTTGSGNFMIINGFPNGNPQPIVWQETVTVLPNTTYYFAAWGISLNSAGPFAQLQFNVNGAQVGTVATLPAGVNNNSNNGWTRFYGTWTSGPTTTTAVIAITDLQNAAGGNDFGLDDISFATLSTFITLESAPGTDAQTLCVNTPITNIVYSVGNGSPSGPIVTGLPAGVTSSFSGNQLVLSGIPTQSGNFTYTITTTGGCLPTSASGTITVQAQNIVLSSGTANNTICVNTPVSIGYTLSGTATGATVTGLPSGVNGTLSGTTYTISGTPTVVGTFNYTITTTGTCTPVTISGTIIVQSQTITLNSGNNNQTVCINSPIANIQYTVGGTGTGATVSGLPAGVSFTNSGGIIFIFGSPTVPGTYTYTVTTTGSCSSVSATGTLNVTAAANLVLSSVAGSNAQSVCRNVSITNITYTVNGATGATVTGLPAGVTGVYNAGVVTISGIPTVNGVYNYTVTTSGGCGIGTATGSITVQSQTITLTSGIVSPSLCINSSMTNIVFTLGGTATGATITGLPSGVTYAVSGSTLTISGTPTVSGTFPYTINTTGNCATATTTGTITVLNNANGGTVASVVICSGGSGTLTITGQSGSIVRWEYTTDGGTTWTPVANTTITQSYSNIVDPTGYRAVVTNGCGNSNSSIAWIAIRNYWTGIVNSDWHNANNWADNLVPSTLCADVHIRGGKPHQPTIFTGSASIQNIHIYPGAILTVDDATLRISGTINNSGTFIANDQHAIIELNGSAAQSIPANTFQNNALGNLKINNSSVQGVTIDGPLDVYYSVTFSGTGRKLNTGGFLTFKSTAQETAWLGDVTGNTIVGDATVERYIATGTNGQSHGKSWQLLATPTTGQTIKQAWQEGATTANGNPNPGFGTMLTSNVPNAATQPNPGFDVFTAPGPSIKTYVSATNTFVGPASTADPIYNPKGYFILVRGDRSVIASNQAANATVLRTKGTLFTPANPAPVTTVNAGTFESVGNPYPSALDIRNIGKTGGVDEFFYVWDPRLGGSNSLGAYQTLFKVGSNYFAMPGGGSYGSGVNNFIQSGQAFLVQATGSNGTISFTENAKAAGSDLFTRQNENAQAVTSLKMLKTNLYTVNSDGSTILNDGTLNLFDDAYSNDEDGLDARKPNNTAENISVKVNNKLFAIERRHRVAQRDTIYLNLAGVKIQSYSFEFTANDMADAGLEGFVEDLYLNQRTALNLNGSTTLNFNIENVPASYASNRFRIVFSRNVVLPVTFTSIKANKNDKKVDVEWKTENEINVKQYEVQKSATGSEFTTFAIAEAKGNNGNNASYLAKDESPVTGYNYYRVRSVDNDGKVQYSTIAKVLFDVPKSDIAIYPNPITNGIVNLQLINMAAGEYGIRLYNKAGQVIMTKQVSHTEGTGTVKLNWDYSLAHGMYYLEVIEPDGNKKVIKVVY
ncbi:MAG: Ig-like domain-containing protein [Bacteroidetes bacterium]|nr:Ig-like domain-containing protein [Bacteroidota bacterium]